MGFHIVGRRIKLEDSTLQRCRYWGTINEKEFKFIQDMGRLPKHFWIWHFEEDETLENSERLRLVYELPYLVELSPFCYDPVIRKPIRDIKNLLNGGRDTLFVED